MLLTTPFFFALTLNFVIVCTLKLFFRFFRMGYERILFARPELQNFLHRQIPPCKIHMSKRVLSFEQNDEGVTVHFSDNTTIHGDILVGADGSHSAVRQHLYRTLDKERLLPKSDIKDMNKGYVSLVGMTETLDPVKYPGMLKEDSESNLIIGDKNTPYTVSLPQFI